MWEAEQDARFRRAVEALDAGDAVGLRAMLAVDPGLATERLGTPGAWLREVVGGALDDFFSRPYLLWFAAEDPVRNGRLPANVVECATLVIETARAHAPETLREQVDHALKLVAWSWIARECGVQLPLIDLLVDAGAALEGNVERALVNGNVEAAEHFLNRGAALSHAAALYLERWEDADRLAASASAADMRFAFVLAAMRGNAAALRRALAQGAEVNAPCENLYSHGTPLHHAVSSGEMDAVRVVAEAGGDLDAMDSVWKATPQGWAEYYVANGKDRTRAVRYAAIADYLRDLGERRRDGTFTPPAATGPG